MSRRVKGGLRGVKTARRTSVWLLGLCLPVAMAHAQSRTVVLDAAHGGPDTGTVFAPQVFEKNIVLALSVHLRSALAARGFAVVTTRENDTNPTPETRSAEANHANAAACIVLHATANGTGVHLYTSSLAQAAPPNAGGLVPWSAAAAPFATQSLEFSSEVARAMTSAGVPYTVGSVRLAGLDALRCPTVVVEVAPWRSSPTHSGYAPVDDGDYQSKLVDALAAACMAWRSESAHGGSQ
jgi:N-acetylmuramoyl-L-alanine amidase